MLHLEHRWVWDFWIADTADAYHVFYLQAPRSLEIPDLRHRHASIGHAVSNDLRSWTVLPDALTPGGPGAWDEVATWTGSVIRRNGRWHMFYTGTTVAEDALVQRIGLATSDDLMTWTRHPDNPLIEADPQWYELLDLSAWHDQAWRDPWVFEDPSGDGYHALITARAADGPADARGVIGHARSPDLVRWTVEPPLTVPGEFGQLEVPQVELVGGIPTLLFSCGLVHTGQTRRGRTVDTRTGTYACAGLSMTGPFDIAGAIPVGPPGWYSGRIVRDRSGHWVMLGFVDWSDGQAGGVIGDPVPFTGAMLVAPTVVEEWA